MKTLSKESARGFRKNFRFLEYIGSFALSLSLLPVLDLWTSASRHTEYYLPILILIVGLFGISIVAMLVFILSLLMEIMEGKEEL